MPILTSADYPAIRAAIDTSLDTAALPDSTITLPIYLEAADLEVKRRDPNWASRIGDQATLLKHAAIYLTAALLVPAVPQIKRETFADHEYDRQLMTAADLVASLRARASASLDALSETTTAIPLPPKLFGVGRGRRGQ